jgi:hypothetical protein
LPAPKIYYCYISFVVDHEDISTSVRDEAPTLNTSKRHHCRQGVYLCDFFFVLLNFNFGAGLFGCSATPISWRSWLSDFAGTILLITTTLKNLTTLRAGNALAQREICDAIRQALFSIGSCSDVEAVCGGITSGVVL